jgi:heptaprenyl diphosphate synthase
MGNRASIEKLIFIAMLVALSIVLSFIDRQLSVVLVTPGARIGLANIVVLTGIYYMNTKDAILLVVLKALLSGLLMGNMMAFWIGLSGSVLSFIVMYLLLKVGRDRFSLIGVSLSGSIAHNIGQILVLTLYYTWSIIFSLFWLIPIGIGTGIFIGTAFTILKNYLNKGNIFKNITSLETEKLLIIEDDIKTGDCFVE